jgi:hypothetical protein
MEQKRINDGWDVEYIFMDTSAEHPKTYEFIKKCVDHFGINLTCLQADFNQPVGKGHSYNVVAASELKHDPVNGVYGQMMRKYGVPTVASPWCTSRMKEETYDKYCNDKYGKGNYITWIGIRIDEPKRIRIPNNKRIRYLAELSNFEKEDVLEWWKSQTFNLEIEEHLGNCVFCFKKSIGKIALAARDEPGILKSWQESIINASDRLNGPIIKETGGMFNEIYTQHVKKGVMYRGNNTVESIIAKFELFERDEIKNTLKSMKKYDSGSCSESCEAFGQVDMFKEEI